MRPLSYICRCLTGSCAKDPCQRDVENKEEDNKEGHDSRDVIQALKEANDAGPPDVTKLIPGATSYTTKDNGTTTTVTIIPMAADAPSDDEASVEIEASSEGNTLEGLGKICSFKPPSIAEHQMPIFQCLAAQLKEAQAIIQKLEQQSQEQDRLIRKSADMACKREQALEAKLKAVQRKADSADAIGTAAKALENVTSSIQGKIAEAQEMKRQLQEAEAKMICLREENNQMKACLECMKNKMLEAEQCGARSVKNWKSECDKLKTDICCLRTAAEDLCEQLHEANRKCAKLEGVQTRLKDVCADDISSVSSSSHDDVSDVTANSASQQVSAKATESALVSLRISRDGDSADVLNDAQRKGASKRKYQGEFKSLAKKLVKRDTAEHRLNDWHPLPTNSCIRPAGASESFQLSLVSSASAITPIWSRSRQFVTPFVSRDRSQLVLGSGYDTRTLTSGGYLGSRYDLVGQQGRERYPKPQPRIVFHRRGGT